MGLLDDLGSGPVALDTSIFVYLIEEDPRFLGAVLPVFSAASEGRYGLVASTLTLMEVLVMPYRHGDIGLAHRYEALLTGSREIRLIDIGRDLLRTAARLRAATGVRTPDAIQLAAARAAGCSAFVTNDRRLPSVTDLPVIQLGAYAR